jgi:hypothetical protein
MVATNTRRPLFDRPWFWVHCFSLAGLAGMMLMSEKIEKRQSQNDANFEKRMSSLAGETANATRAEGSARFVRFGPLACGLAAVAVISWWKMRQEGFDLSERTDLEAESEA